MISASLLGDRLSDRAEAPPVHRRRSERRERQGPIPHQGRHAQLRVSTLTRGVKLRRVSVVTELYLDVVDDVRLQLLDDGVARRLRSARAPPRAGSGLVASPRLQPRGQYLLSTVRHRVSIVVRVWTIFY